MTCADPNCHIPHDHVHVGHAEGVKHDGMKPRVDLLPPQPILDAADVLRFGAAKYGERNWEQGIVLSRLYGAALRHLMAFWMGEDIDPESGMPHLAHATCSVLMLADTAARQPGLDDRPAKGS